MPCTPLRTKMARRAKSKQNRPTTARSPDEGPAGDLRIVGGSFRGRKLRYHGRLETRPMKHRVREAIFNLVGPAIKDKHAIDLFAGTGAIGLEALSRGAASATFVERHIPTARLIDENIAMLGVEDISQVTTANALLWPRHKTPPSERPWALFISPPYDLYVTQLDGMLALIERLIEQAPGASIFVVEADARFDFTKLPHTDCWDVRSYPPAMVAILRTDEVEA